MPNRFRALAISLLALALGVPALPAAPAAAHGRSDRACAWPIRADRETLNVAYPDTGATYFVHRYSLLAGQRLRLSGSYPEARYFSLITYDREGNVVDSLADVAIAPDRGSRNPFTDPDAGHLRGRRRWTVVIDTAVAAGVGGNRLAASASAGAAAEGSVILRVYVPDDPTDARGGVPLPTIKPRGAGPHGRTLRPCREQGPDDEILDLLDEYGPPTDTPPPPQPVFIRPLDTAGLYPNPDNAYVATVVRHTPGEVVVVRGRAPSFPDTRAGESPASAAQLRYWSLCTNEYRTPYPVTDCAADHETALDASGAYTVVISTPADRPANADAEHGVTWLDWGSTAVNGLLLLRHMLPAADFTQSAHAVPPGQLAVLHMGANAPVGRYCATTTFETGGTTACGL